VPRASREVGSTAARRAPAPGAAGTRADLRQVRQILSTRRDLLPPDIADELSLLQDRVAPFDGQQARAWSRRAGRRIAEAYASFDTVPLASASIAQVHAATLPPADGRPAREVVVKVLRPGIERQIDADIALLRARRAGRAHPSQRRQDPPAGGRGRDREHPGRRTRPAARGRQRLGAAPLLAGLDDLYVPEVVWTHTAERVLTLERVRGIPPTTSPRSTPPASTATRWRPRACGCSTPRCSATTSSTPTPMPATSGSTPTPRAAPTRASSRWTSGSWASCPSEDQYYLAENFMAIFNRDYRRIAELHVEAGWMPATCASTNWRRRARGLRAVLHPAAVGDLAGEVLVKLFRTAQRYELTLQPQLILLQKTLLNIEGVGRLLDPKLDIWAVARPVLERILRERYSPARLAASSASAARTGHPRAGDAAAAARLAAAAGRRAGTLARAVRGRQAAPG
jgi:ubiquinone biosynthesis protein